MRVTIAGITVELNGVEDLVPEAADRYRPFASALPADLSCDLLQCRGWQRLAYDLEEPQVVVRSKDGEHVEIERIDNPFQAMLDLSRGRGRAAISANVYCLDSLLRVLYSILLVRDGGLLVHAAAVRVGDGAMLFAGRSEAGKTTLCGLGFASVLSDELVAVRPGIGGWFAHGTPFWGEARPGDNPSSARVAGLYLLGQGARHEVREVAAASALFELLGCCVFFGPPECTGSVLGACEGLAREAFRGEFLFKPDASVVRFVDREAMRHAS